MQNESKGPHHPAEDRCPAAVHRRHQAYKFLLDNMLASINRMSCGKPSRTYTPQTHTHLYKLVSVRSVLTDLDEAVMLADPTEGVLCTSVYTNNSSTSNNALNIGEEMLPAKCCDCDANDKSCGFCLGPAQSRPSVPRQNSPFDLRRQDQHVLLCFRFDAWYKSCYELTLFTHPAHDSFAFCTSNQYVLRLASASNVCLGLRTPVGDTNTRHRTCACSTVTFSMAKEPSLPEVSASRNMRSTRLSLK